MLTITSNEQVLPLIKDGILKIDDDIELALDDFKINADLICKNICGKNYRRNISAGNISAGNISAGDISARNISAWNISAGDISAWNISAWDISAGDISAWDISYFAFCIVYRIFKCKSIKGKRANSFHKCLDSEIIFIGS